MSDDEDPLPLEMLEKLAARPPGSPPVRIAPPADPTEQARNVEVEARRMMREIGATAECPALPVATMPYDRRSPHCGHESTYVDDDARRVTCASCGAELDPIAVLVGLARHFERWQWMTNEKRSLQVEITALHAERTKLRSSVRGMAKRRA